MARRCVAGVGLVLCMLAALGCGSRQKPAPAPEVLLSVRSEESTNAGRPLHVLVRSVDFKTFVEESYQDVAGLVVAPDASVLATFIVFPGSAHAEKIAKPEKGGIAMYFLFTEPGNPWKRLFEEPLAKRIEISLEENHIVDPEVGGE